MSEYDWNLSAGLPLCLFSDSFYRIGRETIFQQLTKETTPEQWQAVLESLQQLREELERDMPAMHYGALVGSHRCVKHLYREAKARLRGLQILQPAPELPPTPPQPQMTLEDVVRAFGEPVQPYDEATYIGTDDDEQDDW